ncbi:hypothetical protein [Sandaracinus amylolyticus]|uniref:hypothetical protein n=1 Tax=Sandaracinus amylolyticus TaxID=927083 RepID=UPI001F36DA2F|nr:hypothetical protein [Sandaracinus amylolyticus]UJR83741.1 Hypothetical protein I5071_58120 [Sandaracinus amylolyticus]
MLTRALRALTIVSTLLALTACDASSDTDPDAAQAVEPDAGVAEPDAASDPDAGEAMDAALVDPGDAAVDAGSELDAASPEPDAAPPVPDAGHDASTPDAGPPMPTSWARAYGLGGAHNFRDVVLLDDGSFVVVGESPVYGAGSDEAIAARIDRDGTVIWARTLGGASYDRFTSVALTDDGEVIAAGQTGSFGPRLWAAFVVRFARDGTVRWQRAIASASYNYDAASIRALGGDRYLISGLALADDQRIVVTTIDGSGAIVAQRGAGGGAVLDALRLGDGSVVVAGQTRTDTIGAYYADLARVAADGRDVWRIHENQNATDEANVLRALVPAHDGGVVAVGTASLRFGNQRRRIWAISVAEDGTIRWQRTFGGAGASEGFDVVAIDGGYVVLGRTSAFGDASRWRGWILGLNASGNVTWQRTYSSDEGSQWLTAGAVSASGELVAVGVTYAPSGGEHASGLVVRLEDRALDGGPCSAEPAYVTTNTAIGLDTPFPAASAPRLAASAGAATIADLTLAVPAVCSM